MAIMPPTREYSPPIEAPVQTGIEFDLLDLLLVIAERKIKIILATFIGLFLGMVLVLSDASCLYRKGCNPATAARSVKRRHDNPAG